MTGSAEPHVDPPRPFDDESVTDALFRRWYPDVCPAPEEGVFEIGLVLAGAVSAGAYTAGVMDFLFQALDAWNAAKKAGEDVPRHSVRLRVIAGASAGGINGAIAAAASRYEFPPATAASGSGDLAANPFYDTWVRRVRIEDLLDTSDLDGGGELRALLNCSSLREIANGAIDFSGPAADPEVRAWLADPLRLALTVTDLGGVPYAVRFAGGSGLSHEMTMHSDHLEFGAPVFQVPGADDLPPDVMQLSLRNGRGERGWPELASAALATSAFPLALEAPQIGRQPTDYEYRFAYMTGQGEKIFALPWPPPLERQPIHRFWAVDGGTMNNEPFDVAHTILAGRKGENPRTGDAAVRAIVMVDPFSDMAGENSKVGPTLPSQASALLRAFKAQTRFKQIDLSLAQAADVYSRFLVSPTRGDHRGAAAIASGGLGGFFGFFDESFRHHDFMLGRRNCQRFLRDWFVLPAANPVVAGSGAGFLSRADARSGHAQIVPLVGAAAENVPRPAWPDGAFGGWSAVGGRVERRLDRVYRTIRDATIAKLTGGSRFWGAIFRAYIWLAWKLKGRSKIVAFLRDTIDRETRKLTTLR